MDFNQMNRALQGRVDPVLLNVLGELYLMLDELSKQQSLTGRILIKVVDQMGEVVELHKMTQDNVKKLVGWGKTDGITIHSEEIPRE